MPLTTDHSMAACPSEADRILAAGGIIDGGRVGGFLEVTRALGDIDSATGGKPLGLTAEPELRSEQIYAEDEFLLLGSDGLFGVLSSDDAVYLARNELRAYGDASMASEKLVEVALKRHADDNITALVVCLNPIAPAPPVEGVRPRLQLLRPTTHPVQLSDGLCK